MPTSPTSPRSATASSRTSNHDPQPEPTEQGTIRNTAGITWHAITLELEPFAATKKLMIETLGLTPAVDMEGFVMFAMPNGTMLELYAPAAVPPYGYNEGLAFGFRVDDIDAASAEIAAAGGELLGEITRMADIGYAYRHFRGPDGRVYGLNQQD